LAKKSEFLARLEDTIIEKLEKADLQGAGTFILEEGLYLALMADLFLVSGRFRCYEGDGTIGNPKTSLCLEREVLSSSITALRKISTVPIPFTDLAPLAWATPLLESWESALGAAEDVGGVVYYKRIPKHMRMFLVLGLPAMLRIAVQLTRQLIQLAKP